MTRYTPPQRHLKSASKEPSAVPAKAWRITWNVLFTAMAFCIMAMWVCNRLIGIAVLILAPLIYVCFLGEEVCRRNDGQLPRVKIRKQLNMLLCIAFTTSLLALWS